MHLLDGSYKHGGVTQLLWVASAGLIAWAATKQIVMTWRRSHSARQPNYGRSEAWPRRQSQRLPLPSFCFPASSSARSETVATSACASPGGCFCHRCRIPRNWIINTQRKLSGAVEVTRAGLPVKVRNGSTTVLESTSDSVMVVDRNWRIEFFNQRAFETVKAVGKLDARSQLLGGFPRHGRFRPWPALPQSGRNATTIAGLEAILRQAGRQHVDRRRDAVGEQHIAHRLGRRDEARTSRHWERVNALAMSRPSRRGSTGT